jgi:hypothetical protein
MAYDEVNFAGSLTPAAPSALYTIIAFFRSLVHAELCRPLPRRCRLRSAHARFRHQRGAHYQLLLRNIHVVGVPRKTLPRAPAVGLLLLLPPLPGGRQRAARAACSSTPDSLGLAYCTDQSHGRLHRLSNTAVCIFDLCDRFDRAGATYSPGYPTELRTQLVPLGRMIIVRPAHAS